MADAILQAGDSKQHPANPCGSRGFGSLCRTRPHVQQGCMVSAPLWGDPTQCSISTSKGMRCCWSWAETQCQVLWWHKAGGEGAGGVLPLLWSLVSAASGGGREGGPEIPCLIPYNRVRCPAARPSPTVSRKQRSNTPPGQSSFSELGMLTQWVPSGSDPAVFLFRFLVPYIPCSRLELPV